VVRSCCGPLARVPDALNCCVVLGALLAAAGVTVIDATMEVLKDVNPEMLPSVAVMFVDPIFEVLVASPCEPCALPMVAIVVSDEFHVTVVVITRWVLSEYVPVAVSRIVVPGAILVFAGVTAMEVSVDGGGLVSLFVRHEGNKEIENTRTMYSDIGYNAV
jgi:hypothetical protein